MERCDVLIVGGGPAGSSAALGLARAGLDALVIDRADFPRDKTCAGWVTPPVLGALGIDPDGYAEKRLFQPITGFRIRRIGDREARIRCGEPVSYGILRCEFDHHLLARCGARLRLGERVRAIERARGRWIVNGAIEARILVGAGGHFCPVARHVGAHGASRAPREIAVLAQEAEFELAPGDRARCDVDPAVPELFFTADLAGYGWIFRKGHHLNVGLGRRDPHRLGEHVARFVDFLCAEGRLRAPPPAPFRGHGYLLYDDAPRPLSGDGFVLVGDAAGLAYGRSGEGIRPAVESGLLAAHAIASRPARSDAAHLSAYAAAIAARFGRRGPRGGPGLTGLLPAAWTQKVAGALFANPRFARRVVVDRWFLNARQAPL
jgi:geranylgeranyl reductase family protein